MILCPSRNSDFETKTFGTNILNYNGHLPIPGISGFLTKFDGVISECNRSITTCKKVHVNVVFVGSINISGYRSHKTRDVSRTTGTTKPGCAVVVVNRFERIVVEEFVAAQ